MTALLAEKGLTLAQPIVANDDITKAAFINQGMAVTVLERSEARALEKENKVSIWKAGDPLSTELSLVYLKSGSNRPPLKIVADAVEKIWAEADEYAAISGQK